MIELCGQIDDTILIKPKHPRTARSVSMPIPTWIGWRQWCPAWNGRHNQIPLSFSP